MAISPLTGLELLEGPTWQSSISFYLGEPIGRWAATEHIISHGFLERSDFVLDGISLNSRQVARVRALISSKAYLAKINNTKPPLVMTNAGREMGRQRGVMNGDDWQAWRVWTIEDLWQEARLLTLEQKAYRTLQNIRNSEPEVGTGVGLCVSLDPFPGGIGAPTNESASPIGLTYGCVNGEIPMAFRLLRDQGYIVVESNGSAGVIVYPTPTGYSLVDSIEQGGAEAPNSAFLVCRYIDELDRVYNEVYKPTGDHEDVRCPIHRVMDVHHIDRIDDRIIQEISLATIVIVDLTEQTFNVAFEAGYALALKKPIVWTMRRPNADIDLPFDIQSQNILIWEPDKLEEFAEALRYRMRAAMLKSSDQPR